MSARALLEELRERDVRLKANGLILRVDAPVGADTGELRVTLRKHKHALIRLLERERKKLEEADRRGLVIRWSRESGYVSIHDPTTGEWHEVPASGCPPWVLDEAKARRRFGGLRR
jgi:hypothetical protein